MALVSNPVALPESARRPDRIAALMRAASTYRTERTVDGSKPDLNAADIAIALPHAPPLAVAAYRWRYLEDPGNLPSFTEDLNAVADRLATRDAWPACVDPRAVVQIVLTEEKWLTNKRTYTRRARCAGISLSTWRRRWRKGSIARWPMRGERCGGVQPRLLRILRIVH